MIPAPETEACCHMDTLRPHGRKLAGEGAALFYTLALLMVIGWPWEYRSLSWWFHAVVIMATWAAGVYVILLHDWLLPDLVKQSVARHHLTQDHRCLYPCENAHEWGPPEAGASEVLHD